MTIGYSVVSTHLYLPFLRTALPMMHLRRPLSSAGRVAQTRGMAFFNLGAAKPGSVLEVPAPVNDPNRGYRKGSPELENVHAALAEMVESPVEVPLLIGDREVKTGDTAPIRCPHNHNLELGVYHRATDKEVKMAIEASMEAKKQWNALPARDRLAVFVRMGELLRTDFRPFLNAATILGQSKNLFQAEIDSASEMVDFLNFNVAYAQQIYEDQPVSGEGVWNRLDYRPLEGFVYAVSPFNFTAIAGNLACAPAMMGNTVVWKIAHVQLMQPSDHAMLSGYWLTQLYKAAGLPPGVINMIPGEPVMVTREVLSSRDFGGLHFTGGTAAFENIWRDIGNNIEHYKSYPRIVGETGGKDFIFAHNSANVEALATAMVRGAFEYQGQKCSAASRAYVPRSIWDEVKRHVVSQVSEMNVGDAADPTTAVAAVIHEASFTRLSNAIDDVAADDSCEIITGGKYDNSEGWFIQPTVVVTTDVNHRYMKEELFGPFLTVFVYEDDDLDATLEACDSSQYSLTGAVFGDDRYALRYMEDKLINSAGNFYINDKPTGAVVGQQPFGGSRKSGTNDKAGSYSNLLRWVNMRTVKETLNPPTHFKYPYMRDFE